MKKLDLENWNRKGHFEFFTQFEEPFFGITAPVEVATAYEHAKNTQVPFFIYYLHKILAAVNTIENFKYRIQDNQVFIHEKIDTSALLVAQMDRSVDISNATRFSYVDNMIKMMLSTSFAAKVFSLLFSDVLGILYIYLIHRIVVFNFLKTMVHAATLYLTNMMKIIFVLCLGPIFIAFSLFAHTKNMFQNWLSFLGSRSLEIILIFAIPFVTVWLVNYKNSVFTNNQSNEEITFDDEEEDYED